MFARYLGISPQRLNNFLDTGGGEVRTLSEDVISILKDKGINDIWVLRGIGEPFFYNEGINRSDKTMYNYRRAYVALIPNDALLTEDNVTKQILYFLATTQLSKITIFTYITKVQIFLNYCTKKHWLPKIELKKDYKISLPDNDVKQWKLEEIQKLMKYFKGQLKNMILFQMFTGARLIDALTYKPSDYNNGLLEFRNKITKKREIVPVTYFVQKLLQHYKPPVTYAGSSFLHKQLREACKVLGIDRQGRSYQEFRIYYRMHLIKKGLPEPYIKFLMRHSTLQITDKFYTEFNIKEIQKLL